MRRVFSGVFVVPLTALIIALLCGCDDDARLARMAETAADRQAEQNSEMARLNREVAEGTRRLVEADADSRKDLVALQQELQSEQAMVGHQRDLLESERREIADQRLRESTLAPILEDLGPLLVCTLVLVFCAFLVCGLNSDKGESDAVTEILIEDIVAERPTLLPPRVSRHNIDDRKPMSPILPGQSVSNDENAAE